MQWTVAFCFLFFVHLWWLQYSTLVVLACLVYTIKRNDCSREKKRKNDRTTVTTFKQVAKQTFRQTEVLLQCKGRYKISLSMDINDLCRIIDEEVFFLM